MPRGKLIVFEGIDGAGIDTNAQKTVELLRELGYKASKFAYPKDHSPIGKFIRAFLKGKFDLNPFQQFALYLADIQEDQEKIEKLLSAGVHVVCARYATSTIAYQSAAGMDMEKAISIVKEAGILEPDLVIFLRVSPETGTSRKRTQKGKLDRFESAERFLEKVNESFEELRRSGKFGKEWAVIDAERSVDEVFEDVRKRLEELVGLKAFKGGE